MIMMDKIIVMIRHFSFSELHKKLDDKEYVVEFDFLGKDSIHYHNIVPVEKRVGTTTYAVRTKDKLDVLEYSFGFHIRCLRT